MASKNKENVLNRGAACLECRKRKLKCDAAKPYCGACVKSGRQSRCIYEAIRNKNLADQLEDRVNQLERMVERMERASASAAASSSSSTPATASGMGQTSGSSTYSSDQASFTGPGLRMDPGSGSEPVEMPLTLLPWHSSEGWSRLPAESHDFMVDTFMTYLPKSYLQIHPDWLQVALSLPEDDLRSTHPAMISAIYLLACYHWSESLSGYEETFLTQTRSAMTDSLAKTDRLLSGFIQPGILMAEYLLNRGRFREAYHQIIQITRLSLDCGLHKITGPVVTGGLLPVPADTIELGERIFAFWAVFILDLRASMIMGVPSSFSRGDDLDNTSKIVTVWPESLYEYEDGKAIYSESMTLHFLCTDRAPFVIQDSDIGFKLRLESFALYWFASEDDTPIAELELAISQILRRLPSPDQVDLTTLPSVIVARVVARAAMIKLCARRSALQTMDERALEAALDCSHMCQLAAVSDTDMWSIDLALGYIWADCAKIIARHIQGQVGGVPTLHQALAAILTGLSKAAGAYPVLANEVRMVEGLIN